MYQVCVATFPSRVSIRSNWCCVNNRVSLRKVRLNLAILYVVRSTVFVTTMVALLPSVTLQGVFPPTPCFLNLITRFLPDKLAVWRLNPAPLSTSCTERFTLELPDTSGNPYPIALLLKVTTSSVRLEIWSQGKVMSYSSRNFFPVALPPWYSVLNSLPCPLVQKSGLSRKSSSASTSSTPTITYTARKDNVGSMGSFLLLGIKLSPPDCPSLKVLVKSI